MRCTQSLNGTWQFQIDPAGEVSVGTLSPDREIAVPSAWQTQSPDLIHYQGWAWYRRTFAVESDWLNGAVYIVFGAVDYWCEVYINGVRVGEHEGGYLPFRLPIHHALRAGENTLSVRVFDTRLEEIRLERHPRFPVRANRENGPFDAQSIPHGKQEWYLSVSGIWSDVSLLAVPATHIDSVRITPSISGDAQVNVTLTGQPLPVTVTLLDGETILDQAAGAAGAFHLYTRSPRLWSPDEPALYTMRIRVGDDQADYRFGFREIAARDGQIWLNGKPIYLRCALDQDFYPDTIYTVPSAEYLRDQFRKAKDLGLNALRVHIKVPEPIYLDLADEMGLLVWQEIPSWRTFYPKGTYHPDQTQLEEAIRTRASATLEAMIARDYNHPSVFCWTIINEDWGTMLPMSASDRAWVRNMVAQCRRLDPTRLVVDNSPCPVPWGVNMHVESDLDDFHVYANIPDSAHLWEDMMCQLNLRAGWTYSAYGDAVRRGDEPILVSEFGSWGLPSLSGVVGPEGNEPHWFRLGPWWSGWEGEPGWISGVRERFAKLGLAAIFGDYEAMAAALQWHQFQALQFDIETMRRRENIRGYVITEMTDTYWEANGLLDFQRRPKAFYERFHQINAPDVLLPNTQRYAYWDDEPIQLRIEGSFYHHTQGGSLEVTLGTARFTHPVAAQPPATVQALAEIALPPASASQTGIQPIEMKLISDQGEIAACNQRDVLILASAARQATFSGEVAVTGTERQFRQQLKNTGYHLARRWQAADVTITTQPDAALLNWLADGGRALFIVTAGSPFYWAQSRGGAYSGNWLTCWSWLRAQAHRRLSLPTLSPLKLPFMAVMPTRTITGLPVEDEQVQSDFLAGQISGWVNHPAIHTVQFRYGKGQVIMTTFNLVKPFGSDPVATAMLHDLVDQLAQAEPTLRLR